VLRGLQIPGGRLSDLSARPHGSPSRAVKLLRARDGVEDFNAQRPQRRQRLNQPTGDEIPLGRENLVGRGAGERRVKAEGPKRRREREKERKRDRRTKYQLASSSLYPSFSAVPPSLCPSYPICAVMTWAIDSA